MGFIVGCIIFGAVAGLIWAPIQMYLNRGRNYCAFCRSSLMPRATVCAKCSRVQPWAAKPPAASQPPAMPPAP